MPTVPLLASVADLSASQIAGASSQLVPSGVVMAFAGASAPSGWLLCDGSLINRTTYANLFAAISTAHGSGDGSTTFALPNYAGRFLRGRANGSANDPDRASRTASAAGGLAGDNVGSVQGNATAKNGLAVSITSSGAHSHTDITGYSHSGYYGANSGGANPDVGYMNPNWGRSASSTGSAHTHTNTVSGDNETRPVNAYVNYIIKI